jgi:MATE family multidrug resistance protein
VTEAAAGGPITHRRVLAIALPVVLANATIPVLGAVNTGVIGQLGLAAPLGAVGLGAVILSAIYWLFGFLRMGTTGLAAQARGSGDVAETGALLMRALILGAAGGLGFVLLQAPLFWAAFRIAPASDEVEALARTYLSIRVWGAPPTIAMYAVTGWLIALERTRALLLMQLWMNGINVALSFLFVLGLGWGVQGVAAASLVAEWSGLAMGLWLCRAAFRGTAWRDWGRIFDRGRIARMAQVNGDILVRSVLLQVAFTSFIFLGAGRGDVTLAANHVLLQFLEITAFALDGFAFAAEALVGGAVGARDRPLLRRAATMASVWGVGLSVPIALFFWFAGPWLIGLMTTAPEVREEALRFLPWIAAAPLIGIASWMLDGIFIGATETRAMRNAALWALVVYILALLLLVPAFGNNGLWASLMVLNIARAVTLALRYPALEARAAA